MPDARPQTAALAALTVVWAGLAGTCLQACSPKTSDELAIDRWARKLSSESPIDRSDAMDALARYGRKALPALIAALDSPSENARSSALTALGNMGAETIPALPAMEAARQRSTGLQRGQAEAEIERVQQTDLKHIPDWISELAVETSGERRSQLMRYLRAAGAAAVPKMVEALLSNPSPDVRTSVAQVLGGLGRDALPAIPALRKVMWDARMGPDAIEALLELKEDVVPELIQALDSRDAVVRNVALQGVVRISPPPQAALPGLTRALTDPNQSTWHNAVFGLQQMGPSARAALPQLLKCLPRKHGTGDVLLAMAHISPEDSAVQAEIRKGIVVKGDGGRSSRYRRLEAMEAAEESGQLAQYASEIRAAARDLDPEIREAAENALARHPELRK